MDKLNCIAIDDEPLALEVIREHAVQLPYVELRAVFTSPLEAMAYLQQQQQQIDLVFLDIHMPELNGMELPRIVQSNAAFVFVTAYKEYAYDSYALNVTDYLLKPVSFDRFVNAVNKVLQRKQNTVNDTQSASLTKVPYLFVRADKKIVRLATRHIQYIEGMKDYVTIYSTTGKIVARESLKKIAELLAADNFVRIHRSYIVPFHAVRQIEGNRVLLDENELPIGASYKSELLQRIDAQLIGDRLRN